MKHLVRYCPECSHVGEVKSGRNCCPDGTHATYIPIAVAEQAQYGFRAKLKEYYKEHK